MQAPLFECRGIIFLSLDCPGFTRSVNWRCHTAQWSTRETPRQMEIKCWKTGWPHFWETKFPEISRAFKDFSLSNLRKGNSTECIFVGDHVTSFSFSLSFPGFFYKNSNFPEVLTISQIPWVSQVFHVFATLKTEHTVGQSLRKSVWTINVYQFSKLIVFTMEFTFLSLMLQLFSVWKVSCKTFLKLKTVTWFW